MARKLTQYIKSLGGGGGLKYDDHIMDIVGFNAGANSCNNFKHIMMWCVPVGISTAKFQIWGSGGMTEGTTSCGFTAPGGSGAYAEKTISVTSGQCYRIQTGQRHCRYPHTNAGSASTWGITTQDLVHGTTSVTGTGLTNFCAEPGYNTPWTCCSTTNYATSLLDSETPYYSQGDSELGPNRACYYGADQGLRGRKSFVTTNSLGIGTSQCNMRFNQALPNCSSWGKCGGHAVIASCKDTMNCNEANKMLGIGLDISYCYNRHLSDDTNAQNWDAAGMGGSGISSCGGTCVCGQMANGGKVRILYS